MALRDLWRLREKDPGNRDVTRLMVDSYYNLGVRELQRADAGKAMDNFQEALELTPRDETLRRHLLFAQTYKERPAGPAVPDLRQTPSDTLMPRRQEQEPDEPLLFDLPLGNDRGAERTPPPPDPSPVSVPAPRAERAPVRPRPEPPPLLLDDAPDDFSPQPVEPEETAGSGRAALGTRLAAGGADLLVHAAIAVGVLVGCRLMGVRPVIADWPAVALFLLSFSFLYSVVPLAFWGHTPGMAWAGLSARSRDGEALSFDQTARRWIGGVLTLLTLGLPLLFAGRGRALSDLLSGSETVSYRP